MSPVLRILLPLALGILLSIPGFPLFQGEWDFRLLLGACAGFLLVLSFIVRSSRLTLLFQCISSGGILLAGILLGLQEQQTLTPACPDSPVCLQGTILETPVFRNHSCLCTIVPEKQRFRLQIRLPEDHNSRQLKAGDALLLHGILRQPDLSRKASVRYRLYQYGQGIGGVLYVRKEEWKSIPPLPVGLLELMIIRAQQLRGILLEKLRLSGLPPTETAWVEALTLGYRGNFLPETKEICSAAGLSHLLALSGMHIGLITLLLSLFLPKHRCPGIVRIPILLAGTWGFIFLAGLPASALRAGGMLTLYLLHPRPDERHQPLDTWALTALLMLLVHPLNLCDIGFQLSFTAVAGILLIGPFLPQIPRLPRRIHQLLSTCLSAQLMVLPLTLWHFGRMPVHFLLSNLLVTGVIFPPVMYLSVALLFSSAGLPLLTPLFAVPLHHLLKLQDRLLEIIGQLPGQQLYISRFGVPELLASYLVIGCLIHYLRQRSSRRLIGLQLSLILFLVLLLLG